MTHKSRFKTQCVCVCCLPTVWQVEGDAASYVLSEAHVSDGAEADVEEGDDAHPQVQDQGEALRPLHLVLQGKNLSKDTTGPLPGQRVKSTP